MAKGQLVDPEGLCRSHPLHFWMSSVAVRLLPVTLPMAMSLVSALAGAIAVANVFGIVRQWTGQWKAAVISAAGLAVSHSFWQFSCIPGAHIISAALVTVELWTLFNWERSWRPRWLILLFLSNGVGLVDHDWALLTLPVWFAVLLISWYRRQISWRPAVASLGAWIVGAMPYLWLVAEQMHADGVGVALRSALVGQWGGAVAGHGWLLTFTATSVAFTLLSFPNLMLPLTVLGIWRGRRLEMSLSFWGLLAALIVQLAFVLRYNVITQYTFLLPAYVMMAVFSGLGIAWISNSWSPAARQRVLRVAAGLTVIAPVFYVAAYTASRHYHVLGGWARNKPYRDDYRYLLIPWARGESSAGQMSRRAAELADDDGLIVAMDGMGVPAIQYQLLSQKNFNVQVTEKMDAATIAQFNQKARPVVLVPQSIDDAPPAPPVGQWTRAGDLYLLNSALTARDLPLQRGSQ